MACAVACDICAERGCGHPTITAPEMWAKGYRFRLTPRSGSFEPLFVKTVNDISSLMRETYPGELFDIEYVKK